MLKEYSLFLAFNIFPFLPMIDLRIILCKRAALWHGILTNLNIADRCRRKN
jgi:hypothetical protein